MERLTRGAANMRDVPNMLANRFDRAETPHSIVNAMREYQAMMDAMRSGLVNKGKSEIPDDLLERSQHLKSFAYFQDASVVGIARLDDGSRLKAPIVNPDITRLAHDLRTKQTKTFAAGMDVLMAELREAVDAPPIGIESHTHAIVFLYEYPRDPAADEVGCEWIQDAQAERATLLGTETANVISNYLRLLGYDARSHSATCSDADLNRLAVLAGLASVEDGALFNPYIGTRFGLVAVTTTLELLPDQPLATWTEQPKSHTHGLAWKLGKGFSKSAPNREPYGKRRFVDGAMPFEKLKRVDKPTTYMDEDHIPRVPKRADLLTAIM